MVLDPGQIGSRLQGLAGWTYDDTAGIRKTYRHHDFLEAIAFVNRIAPMAEESQHHPDIDIRYNKVTVTLITHDAGGVTDKDVDLARRIEQAAADHR